MFEEPATDSVTSFVVRNRFLLLGAQQPALALETRNYSVNRALEVILLDKLMALASCMQSGLVGDVGDIGTRETGGKDSKLVCESLTLWELA